MAKVGFTCVTFCNHYVLGAFLSSKQKQFFIESMSCQVSEMHHIVHAWIQNKYHNLYKLKSYHEVKLQYFIVVLRRLQLRICLLVPRVSNIRYLSLRKCIFHPQPRKLCPEWSEWIETCLWEFFLTSQGGNISVLSLNRKCASTRKYK